MMKRKFLAVVLPIIGCATVVGSGFSAWYFGQDLTNGTDTNIGIGMNITEEIKASKANLTIDLGATTIDDGATPDEEGRLVLDQGGLGNNSVDSGIMFGSNTSTFTKTTSNKIWGFTVKYDGTSVQTVGETAETGLTIKELYDAGLRIRVEMSVTLDATLYKYIDFKDPLQDPLRQFTVTSTDLGTNEGTATFDDKDDTSGSAVITANYIIDDTKLDNSDVTKMDLTFALNLDTEAKIVTEAGTGKKRTDYSNKLFVYQENNTDSDDDPYTGGKPHFSDELATMRGEIASSTVDFTVVGYIEDDPAKSQL